MQQAKYDSGTSTHRLLDQLYTALTERDELKRQVEEYRRFIENGKSGLSRVDYRLLKEGRKVAFNQGWSSGYQTKTAKTYDGRTMSLEEYAARNVCNPPAWMSKEEFVTVFAAEIADAYEQAMANDEGDEDE